jgi:hypothetical protein
MLHVETELLQQIWKRRPYGFVNAKGVSIPVAVTVFPASNIKPAELDREAYPKLIYYTTVAKGGYFAAWKQPQLFATEVRAAFKSLR